MHIVQGSWIVRQSVGSTPCLLGKAVDCNYIRGPNYLEVKSHPVLLRRICVFDNIPLVFNMMSSFCRLMLTLVLLLLLMEFWGL